MNENRIIKYYYIKIKSLYYYYYYYYYYWIVSIITITPSLIAVRAYVLCWGCGCSDKYQCSWIADHQKVDTFEAFREMISQRLSQVSALYMEFSLEVWCHITL